MRARCESRCRSSRRHVARTPRYSLRASARRAPRLAARPHRLRGARMAPARGSCEDGERTPSDASYPARRVRPSSRGGHLVVPDQPAVSSRQDAHHPVHHAEVLRHQILLLPRQRHQLAHGHRLPPPLSRSLLAPGSAAASSRTRSSLCCTTGGGASCLSSVADTGWRESSSRGCRGSSAAPRPGARRDTGPAPRRARPPGSRRASPPRP